VYTGAESLTGRTADGSLWGPRPSVWNQPTSTETRQYVLHLECYSRICPYNPIHCDLKGKTGARSAFLRPFVDMGPDPTGLGKATLNRIRCVDAHGVIVQGESQLPPKSNCHLVFHGHQRMSGSQGWPIYLQSKWSRLPKVWQCYDNNTITAVYYYRARPGLRIVFLYRTIINLIIYMIAFCVDRSRDTQYISKEIVLFT
jgi:hypothetical protein